MNIKLQSKRLQLIQSEYKHAPALFAFWKDPEVTRFMNIESCNHVEEVIELIDLLNLLAAEKKAIRYTIIVKDTNEIIGSCGFNDVDYDNARAEVGYDLGRNYWGKGYATEAVSTLMNYGFNELHLNRIEARVVPKNEPSITLLERLGFQYEGTLRQFEKINGDYTDVGIYSKLKNG